MTEPIVKVVRGNPSDEEIAVVIALFASRPAACTPKVRTVGGWADRRALLRAPATHGPGAWASSARAR